MIISYCTQCGKRNDMSIWPPSAKQPLDACTCPPEPHVTILPPGGSTVVQYNLLTEGQVREMVHKMVAEELATLPKDVLKFGEEVTLEDLRPGAIFVTPQGNYAVKSEYHYPSGVCQSVLLASGEYAHFEDGNATLVREVRIGDEQ